MEKYLQTQNFQYKIASNGTMDTIFPMENFVAVDGINELEIPILGICLGHQLIGKAFGGEVADLIYLPERAFNKEEFFYNYFINLILL